MSIKPQVFELSAQGPNPAINPLWAFPWSFPAMREDLRNLPPEVIAANLDAMLKTFFNAVKTPTTVTFPRSGRVLVCPNGVWGALSRKPKPLWWWRTPIGPDGTDGADRTMGILKNPGDYLPLPLWNPWANNGAGAFESIVGPYHDTTLAQQGPAGAEA